MTDRQNITLGNNYSWALAEFCMRWPLDFMRNAAFLAAEINFPHQHPWASICDCVQRWYVALILPFDKCPQCCHHCHQQCCLGCWFNHSLSMCPRNAWSFVFHVDHQVLQAQKEGQSRSIRQQRWQACPWEMSAVFDHIYACETFSFTSYLAMPGFAWWAWLI